MQAYFIFVFKRELKQSNHLLCGQLFQKMHLVIFISLLSTIFHEQTISLNWKTELLLQSN
jgi:hypothetical protein